MSQAQLETLQTENQHLIGLLQRLHSQSPTVRLLWHIYVVITQLYSWQQPGIVITSVLFMNVTHLALVLTS